MAADAGGTAGRGTAQSHTVCMALAAKLDLRGADSGKIVFLVRHGKFIFR